VLRHQLRVLTRGGKRPRYGTADRALLSAVSRFLPQERWSAFGVVPETLKRWRRQLENRRDRRRRRGPGRPPIDPELRQLILRMGRENPRWGYLRIKGELLKLGITVSATTIANVLRRGGLGRRPGGSGRRGRSSCGPRPSPSFPLVSLPPAWRIGLGTKSGPAPAAPEATGRLGLAEQCCAGEAPGATDPIGDPNCGREEPIFPRLHGPLPIRVGRPRDRPAPAHLRLVALPDHRRCAGFRPRFAPDRPAASSAAFPSSAGRALAVSSWVTPCASALGPAA
jgi:hypothetical protein